MSTVLSMLWFLVVHGTGTLAWTLGGSLLGLLAGVLILWTIRVLLGRYRRRRPLTGAVIIVLLAITVVPLVAVAGGFFGGARAARALVEQQALLREAAQLGFDGAERALAEAHERMPTTVVDDSSGEPTAETETESAIARQVHLALRLVEGEERFPIDSMAELVGSFSDEALRRALAVYESGHARLGERGPLTWIARGLGQRLLTWLIERPQSVSEKWTEPVERELLGRPEHADGLATGRELGLAIVHVHLQQPMAKWTYWAVAIQGWTLLVVAAVFLVGILAVSMFLASLFSPRTSNQDQQTVARGAETER